MTAARCRGVLIVDDDTDIRETLEEVLADNDFPAVGAENGAVALERLRSDVEPPCLILLDMMMPVMDGPTFRLAQQDDPALSSIPVVVLSAHASGERVARELHVAGFLRKPVDLHTLLDVIGQYCERDR
jgi:CheY-like chemotaxis protein